MLLFPNCTCAALYLFLFHLFTLFLSPLPILTILCPKRGCWLRANSVTACENLGFRIKLGSIWLLFTQCRSFLSLHLATTSVGSRSVLTGWLLLGISDFSFGAHTLPQLKLLTSYLHLGCKLDMGFYFPFYQEEPECRWFYGAPGFFSHFGFSFFCLLVFSKILSGDSFSPPQILFCLCIRCHEHAVILLRRCHSSFFPRRPYRMFLFSVCDDPSIL